MRNVSKYRQQMDTIYPHMHKFILTHSLAWDEILNENLTLCDVGRLRNMLEIPRL